MHIMFNVSKEQYKQDLGSSTGSWQGDPGAVSTIKLTAASGNFIATETVKYRIKLSYWTMCYDRTNISAF